MPKLPPEECVTFRVLVQVMVTIGIVLTDLAGGTTFSLWAIGVSAIGATFSWHRRHERNIAVKFLLAIAMLAALGSFFSSLIASPGDTRLALAALLIELQVVHSFDLPRRKDLGYSMVIALVLIGVAGTLSQTLEFGLGLFAFTLVAIPALMLDYRSRLGLPPLVTTAAAHLLPALVGSTLAVLVGGSIAFVLMPRLSGYQWRAFPVSADLPMPKEFNPERLRNPGYPVRGGTSTAGGSAQSATEKPTFDPVQYGGFNSQVDYNLRGKLKPTLMMRVRSQSAAFWRMMAFDEYTGSGWRLTPGRITTLNRQSPIPVFYLPHPNTRLTSRELIGTFNILTEMPNLIPAASWGNQLYFPATQIASDRENALRSPSPLSPGLTYTVISNVPIPDVERLRKAKRLYLPAIRNRYLNLPPGLDPAIARLSRNLTREAGDPYLQALTLAQHLKQTYELSNDVPQFQGRDDVARTLLFKRKGGMPEHFATTLVVMLRSLGVPARLVTGFSSGEYNPFTGYYEVYNTDATAVTEFYLPDYGWFAVDPVPGRPLLPPSLAQSEYNLPLQVWNQVAGWIPSSWRETIARAFAALAAFLVVLFAWVATLFGTLGSLAGLAVLATLAAVVGLVWGGGRLWKRGQDWWAIQQLPLEERLYRQALALLKHSGLERAPTQTPTEFLNAVQAQAPETGRVFAVITTNYLEWRYRDYRVDTTGMQLTLQTLKRLTPPFFSRLRSAPLP